MTDSAVFVEGARELARSLRRAGVDVKELKAANQRVGQIVVQAAQARAPKKTGRLAASIRASKEAAAVTIRAGNNGAIPYAAVQEYGWPRHHISAKHYLTGAIADKRDEVMALYFAELDRIIGTIEGA